MIHLLLSKVTSNWGIQSDSSWRGKQTEEVLVTPGLRHCSNKYELAREGEKDKEKEGLFLLIPYNAAEVLEQRKYYHSQDKAAI